MHTFSQPLIVRVHPLWRITLLVVGSVTTLVVCVRGNLFQVENLLSSILLGIGGVIVILTILFFADALRHNEKGKLHSLWFRTSFALSLLTIYAIFFLVKPQISLIDLTLLVIQSFLFAAFIHSLKSKIILDNNHLHIYSLTSIRTLNWDTITSVRWLDKGTIAILAAEYPKEIYLPLFTFNNKAGILLSFQTNLNKRNVDVDLFFKEYDKRIR